MNLTNEILICANQLANAGKKPTVALVKAKLSQRVPLPQLISALKNWQHQPDFITAINPPNDEQVSQELPKNNTAELIESLLESGAVKKVIKQSLKEELTIMKSELSEMKLLIKNLSDQLNQRK
ncbi:hypothetical protein [Colwellia piezophila]|uniref:hypothetical protein n=1 Tax=Colwellia piezophila TaxID=211668 RepID=UPI00037E48FE|nr:hypothetical protein [Colwellia piezophila]